MATGLKCEEDAESKIDITGHNELRSKISGESRGMNGQLSGKDFEGEKND